LYVQATPFLEMFMRYGRSHMWFGAHLLILLIIALCLGLKASLLAAWANVVAILSLLVAPFWFNPFSLDWQKNKVGLHVHMACCR
jgi:putative flippase GtrA